MQKIRVCLWFDSQGEDAARFYTSVFPNSKLGAVTRYDEASAKASGQPQGSVLTVEFELDGQYWQQLSAFGQEVKCGWLIDSFGVSWQIVPTILPEMLKDKDPEKAKRVMAAMLQMKKLDIEGLKRAYGGR